MCVVFVIPNDWGHMWPVARCTSSATLHRGWWRGKSCRGVQRERVRAGEVNVAFEGVGMRGESSKDLSLS